jgi:hypothetical protein
MASPQQLHTEQKEMAANLYHSQNLTQYERDRLETWMRDLEDGPLDRDEAQELRELSEFKL